MNKKEKARKNRNRGKRNEKNLTKLLDGNRVGIFGGEDISIHDKYSVEAKSRKSFAGTKWYEKCERNCKNKIPLVILHITGKSHENDYCIIKLKYVKEFFK